MRALLRLILAAGLLIGVTPASASAAPITWQYAGVTNAALFSLPIGTTVSLSWTFDSAAPNGCAGAPGGAGLYSYQSLTVNVGGYSYQSWGGLLALNVGWQGACTFLIPGLLEGVLAPFYGPDLPDARLYPGNMSGAWGYISMGSGAPPNGAFPAQPFAIGLHGPYFQSLSDPSLIVGLSANLQAVPEPATLLLLGTGLTTAAILLRRARRR